MTPRKVTPVKKERLSISVHRFLVAFCSVMVSVLAWIAVRVYDRVDDTYTIVKGMVPVVQANTDNIITLQNENSLLKSEYYNLATDIAVIRAKQDATQTFILDNYTVKVKPK